MSAQEAKRLEGIPFVVDEIRKSFSKLKLKTAEVDLEVEGLIATKELRFISWMMSNDAHCDADSSRKSLEHWRRSRPESYAVLSYSLLNVQRLLESKYLDTLESVTSPS
ncbi:hypothetical protein N0V84_005400 [Fusarium piperis]|uniref:Uncharacterized protein n=1 Tax=Fusarium piperis TaxID=1435070 RepID=A0A9W9BP29_9HYPO|nr:hypothetical protein N0V84_005400 [Fusarium piperis]